MGPFPRRVGAHQDFRAIHRIGLLLRLDLLHLRLGGKAVFTLGGGGSAGNEMGEKGQKDQITGIFP